MGAMHNKKRLIGAAVVIAGLAGGAMVAQAAPFSERAFENPSATVQDLAMVPPPVFPAITPTCTTDCVVDLHAGASSVLIKDAKAGDIDVPYWGFNVNHFNGGDVPVLAGAEGSIIKVPVGTTITINLTQDLGKAVGETGGPIDLQFPSLTQVSHDGNQYTVVADKVGTMVFQPGVNADAPRQVAMGMVGVLIVTPTTPPAVETDPAVDCSSCAYDATVPYADEAVVALTDIDPQFAADPWGTDISYFGQQRDAQQDFRRVYHLINGKSFPDTDLIDVRAGDNVLLRYVNAGVEEKNMGLLGLRQELLGRNTSEFTDPQWLVAPRIGAGETADVSVQIPTEADGVFAGQKYSLMDQSRGMNHGTGEGFGGALTFLDVWTNLSPTVDNMAFDLTSNTITATGHPSHGHALTAYRTSVGETPGTPWSDATAIAGVLDTPFDISLALLDPVPSGAIIWVSVQQDTGLWSEPFGVFAHAAPTLTFVSLDTATSAASFTATPSDPLATITAVEVAYTADALTQPVATDFVPLTVGDPTAFTVDASASRGKTLWVHVIDVAGLVSNELSADIPFLPPTVTATAFAPLTSTLAATATPDPMDAGASMASFQWAVTLTAAPPLPADWQPGNTPADAISIVIDTIVAPGDALLVPGDHYVWVQATDSAGRTSLPTSTLVSVTGP
jgi:hypothetical protein